MITRVQDMTKSTHASLLSVCDEIKQKLEACKLYAKMNTAEL